MTHLIVCREYPPALYPSGGIGTYVRHMARILAEAGETVHVLAQQWRGAPEPLATSIDGRLTVHRIPVDRPLKAHAPDAEAERALLAGLAASSCPTQLFSWQTARYVERLLATETIDLIEAQEWEAPLYYLQLRRALGLGPGQQPPILVHLHSPSEMIFHYNGWDEAACDFLPLVHLEEYTIRAADALLCPSRYLARQVEERFHIAPGAIEIIPYPLGETRRIARDPEVWARNAVTYVGRLERRKGIVEWVDAAVQAAGLHPAVSFDFYGSDTRMDGCFGTSMLEHVTARIPQPLRPRFRFHGSRTREELFQALARTSLAVVPSRWENLPFTCIEAMATGLPVLVSPDGGMAELVTDADSGWIADASSPSALAAALERAIRTPPAVREAMGQRASEAVQARCSNEVVLKRHLAYRQDIVQRGARRSLRVPGLNPSMRGPDPCGNREGMGIVVSRLESSASIRESGDAILLQQGVPAVLVVEERLRAVAEAWVAQSAAAKIHILAVPDALGRSAQQQGARSLLESHPRLRSIAFLRGGMRLADSYAAKCESVFARRPEVGLIAPWALGPGKGQGTAPGPCPASLRRGVPSELPPGSALRVEAWLPAAETGAESLWQALADQGWSAVPYPEALVRVAGARPRPRTHYSGMAMIQSDSARFALRWFLAAPLQEKADRLGQLILQPRRMLLWMAAHLRLPLPRRP